MKGRAAGSTAGSTAVAAGRLPERLGRSAGDRPCGGRGGPRALRGRDPVAAALERAGAFAEGGSLRLSRAWPAPGGALSGLYLPVGRRVLAKAWAVLLQPTSGRPERAKPESPAGREAGDGVSLSANDFPPVGLADLADGEPYVDRGGRGRTVRGPDLDSGAFRVADDPELCRAARLLDRDVSAETFSDGLAGTRDLRAVRLLRYKPTRRLTLEFRGPAGAPLLFGKALRRRHLERVVETYERLEGALALEPQPLVARPCGRVEEWGLLLWRPVAGTGLDRLLGGPAAGRGAALAGESLGRLHRCGAGLAASHTRRRELATTRAWVEAARFGFPGEAAVFGRALEHLQERSSEAPVGESVPAHRDFHPGQLLVGRSGATLLDLDDAALAEPELDAGNFLAHLDQLALRGDRRSERLSATFLDAYVRASDRRLHRERLAWYRASALLRLACVYRFRRRGAGEAPPLLRLAVAWTADDLSGSVARLDDGSGRRPGPAPGSRGGAAARAGGARGSAAAQAGPVPAPARLEEVV